MSWAKLDCGFPDHPKIARLDDAAFRLHVSAICYSARAETDGFVPTSMVARLHRRGMRLTFQLVSAGLWEQIEDGFEIHDYLKYNPSKAEADALRKQRTEAASRGGAARAQGKRGPDGQFVNQPERVDDNQPERVDDNQPERVDDTWSPATTRNPPTDTDTVPVLPEGKEVPIPTSVDAWEGYGPEWRPFQEAFEQRRFKLAPTPKQRAMLWPLIEDRPQDVGRWAVAAPEGSKAADVIGYVLAEWKSFRTSVKEPVKNEPSRQEAHVVLERIAKPSPPKTPAAPIPTTERVAWADVSQAVAPILASVVTPPKAGRMSAEQKAEQAAAELAALAALRPAFKQQPASMPA